MPTCPFTNFEIQNYYQNKPRFNDVYSKNNFPKIKDGAYVINLNEIKSVGTHWTFLYVNCNNATYFDSFEVEHINRKLIKLIRNKNIISNIYIFIEYKHRVG